jgi:hypothetical protein
MLSELASLSRPHAELVRDLKSVRNEVRARMSEVEKRPRSEAPCVRDGVDNRKIWV